MVNSRTDICSFFSDYLTDDTDDAVDNFGFDFGDDVKVNKNILFMLVFSQRVGS